MQSERLNLAIIVGSIRAGGFGDRIAGWFAGEAQRQGDFSVDLVTLPPWAGMDGPPQGRIRR